MNWASVVLLFAFICLSRGVILSLEESELGAPDYRYLYFTVPDISGGSYQKPYFILVNNELSRPYGALGSLDCGVSTDGIAVYSDVDNDNLKEWTCQSINLLPFAHQGGGLPSPPLCSIGVPSGTPAIYNATSRSWVCGTYNQILTLATREDLGTSCETKDFLSFFASVDEIRCIRPQDINSSATLGGRTPEEEELLFQQRVDVNHDKKWFVVMSDYDVTGLTSKSWNNWRWTPFLNYDSTAASASIQSPPIVLPFPSTLVAATFASFRVTSYAWVILQPTGTATFDGSVYKLSSSLAPSTVQTPLTFNAISATSGQVTFSFSNNVAAVGAAGETFVGDISNRNWPVITPNSDRHMVTITLWIQTNQSFTEFWPLP